VNTPSNIALSYSDKEAGIQEAIGAWQTNPERSIADIAREFGTSSWAFRRRLHRVLSKVKGGKYNKKLIPDRE
jgi:AraC-like DNA-binding protein